MVAEGRMLEVSVGAILGLDFNRRAVSSSAP